MQLHLDSQIHEMNGADKPRYLVVKYVADIFRMEPKNIGVILFAAGKIDAVYLDVQITDDDISVKTRSARHWCESVDTYVNWVYYWRKIISKMNPDFSYPDIASRLMNANEQRGNYWIAEGGYLLDDIVHEQFSAVLQQLFDILVPTQKKDVFRQTPPGKNLNRECGILLRSSMLDSLPGFRAGGSVRVDKTGGKGLPLRFSYTVSNGSLRSVIQKMTYTKRKEQLENKLQGTAWKMEQVVTRGRLIERQNALVLVDNLAAFENIAVGRDLLGVINDSSVVMDINDNEKVFSTFERIHHAVTGAF